MNTIQKYFPHPVLGLSDDINGEIRLELDVERHQETRTIRFHVHVNSIDNPYFSEMIEKKRAGLLFKVYCSSTFKTFNFFNPGGFFEVNERDVCNKIEIEPYIISMDANSKYCHDTFNSEFENQCFEINKYDIIGLLGKITVPLDQKYERLGIGNLFVFEPNADFTTPMSFDLSLDKIYIKYPPTKEGEHPPNGMFHKNPWAAFNIFIIPALTEVFRIMQDPSKSSEAQDLEWFQVINDLLPESEREKDPFVNAQLILNKELPLLKAYEEMCKN